MFLMLVAAGSLYLLMGEATDALMLLGFVFVVMESPSSRSAGRNALSMLCATCRARAPSSFAEVCSAASGKGSCVRRLPLPS